MICLIFTNSFLLKPIWYPKTVSIIIILQSAGIVEIPIEVDKSWEVGRSLRVMWDQMVACQDEPEFQRTIVGIPEQAASWPSGEDILIG